MGCKHSTAQNPDQPTEPDKTRRADDASPTSGPTDSHVEESLPKAASPTAAAPDERPAHNASQEAHAQTPPANASAGADAAGEGGRKVDAQGRRQKQSQSVPPNFFSAQNHNGFKVIPELPALTVSEENLAAYSLPVEVLTYTPPLDVTVTQFANGDQERKIHCNTRLSQNELERLQAMRGEARAQGISFFPSVTAMATRFLSRARMDPKKAVKLMTETQEWRAGFFADGPVREAEVKEDLKYGICYFSGRDLALRPAMIIRPARIPQKWHKEKSLEKFIRVLIFVMEYFLRYMVVPGRIENLSVIVDLAGLGVSQVPVSAIQELYKVMSHHYIGRVYKFYVCNVSFVLSALAGVVRSILTDRQKQKLNVLDDVTELHKEFALHMLEQDIGGSRPKLAEFFPFPISPGPYTAGYKGAADMNAAAGVHDVLSHAGALGRLWNPKASDEENQRLDYGPKALEVLQRCKLPIPPELLVERNTSESVNSRNLEPYACQDEGENGKGFEQTKEPFMPPSTDNGDMLDNDLGLDEVFEHSGPEIESSRVYGNLFCCRIP